MKKLYFAITAVILFVLLSPVISYASSWPTYKSNSQNNPVVFDAAQNKTTPDYSLPYTNVQTPYGYPVTANGVLYYSRNFGSPQISELYAVDIKTGSEIWMKNFSKPIYNLSIYNNKLYFGADNIYCLNLSDGSEAWVLRAGLVQNPILIPHVYMVYKGVVLAEESQPNILNKTFLAVNAESGQIITNMANYDMTEASGIIADGDNFYISSRNNFGGRISAFDINSFNMIWRGDPCLDSQQPTIDPEQNRIYLLGTTKISVIDSTNGKKLFDRADSIDFGLAKYGDKMYGFFGTTFNAFSAGEDTAAMDYDSVFTWPEKFVSPPLIVNDTLYGGSNKGRIWSRNLETGQEKITTIGDSDDWVYHLIYSDGKIAAITKNNRVGSNLRVLDRTNLSSPVQNYTVTLDSPYKTDGEYLPLLGQLHAHYKLEDPAKWFQSFINIPTPTDVETRYKNAGYDFIALTEHNEITPDPGVEGILHIKNAEEDTQTIGGSHLLSISTETTIDESQNLINRISQILNQSGLPIAAHPDSWFYPLSAISILNTDGLNHLEGFNSSVNKSRIPDAFAFDTADILAKNKKNIFITAGDDYTPDMAGFDGGAVIVFSKTKNQADIMQNLKDGNFYALQGSQAPRINIFTSGNTVTVNSDRLSSIKFIGRGGETLQKFDNAVSASYVASGDEIYIRAEVEANGKAAWSQPMKVNKVKSSQTVNAGTHYTDLEQAGLISNTNDQVDATILHSSEYPSPTPPLGYLSPIYSFATSGQVLDGTKLSISYADKNIATNASNLAIYTFNQATSTWDKIESFVDTANKTVTANLPHFSLYTLSAEQPTDTEKPVVSLLLPTELTNLSGQINFEANAQDNNAVTEVRFFIDDKLITKDININNGWKAEINSNDFTNGAHKLKLEAEDFAGNIGTFEADFAIVNSSFIAPTIFISNPTSEQYLKEFFTISGNYSSQNNVENISIYLNDIYLADADFVNGTFQKEIDFGQFKEGKHALKIALTDNKDNVAETATTINVGDELKITIASPQNKIYLHSESILFQYETTPANTEGASAKLDGLEIANNTTRNSYDLPLGQHKYSVEKNGKVYAEINFTISTNLADQIKLVEILYKTGHIKNQGAYSLIKYKLILAQILDRIGAKNLRNFAIKEIIRFIDQQNRQIKPSIDDYAKNIITRDLNYLLTK